MTVVVVESGSLQLHPLEAAFDKLYTAIGDTLQQGSAATPRTYAKLLESKHDCIDLIDALLFELTRGLEILQDTGLPAQQLLLRPQEHGPSIADKLQSFKDGITRARQAASAAPQVERPPRQEEPGAAPGSAGTAAATETAAVPGTIGEGATPAEPLAPVATAPVAMDGLDPEGLFLPSMAFDDGPQLMELL